MAVRRGTDALLPILAPPTHGLIPALNSMIRLKKSKSLGYIEPPSPSNFTRHQGIVSIKGWHLDRAKLPAHGIRIRVGKRLLACMRDERPELVKSHGADPAVAAKSGFSCIFHSRRSGWKIACVEIQETSTSNWVCVGRVIFHLSPGAIADGVQSSSAAQTGTHSLSSVMNFWKFTTLPEAPLEPAQQEQKHSLKIAFFIPDFNKGAGGHTAIFELAKALKDAGHQPSFWIIFHTKHENPSAYIDQHFSPIGAPASLVSLDNLATLAADIVVATNCWSAYFARAVPNIRRRFYFIQDYEPHFYAHGFEYHYARNTYDFDLSPIVSSRWLAKILKSEHGRNSYQFDYSYTPRYYYPAKTKAPKPAGKKYAIAFYSRVATDRRMVIMGLQALDLIAASRNDFVVHFFGQDLAGPRLAYAYVDHGVLEHHDLGELYRACDLGVVFSATNRSIVPTEMMACGLPVVELDGENNHESYPEGCFIPTSPKAQAVADTIKRLLDDPCVRDSVAKTALAYVQANNWESTLRRLAAHICDPNNAHGKTT